MSETHEVSDATSRFLLVADERFRGSDLEQELRRRSGRSDIELLVIVPALAESALEDELAGVDPGIAKAQVKLEAILSELSATGLGARGHVGDEDPIVAVGDGLREFDAEAIFVVAHPAGERLHAEKNLWDRLEREFKLPIVEMLVHAEPGSDAPGDLVGVERADAKSMTEQEEVLATRNFPPLRTRDIAGIVIGIVGTILLGIIALESGLSDDGDISGATAAILLITIPAFLINAAHIVGILLFQSVRYTGIWDKFMSGLAIGWTTIGLAVALVLWLA